MDLRIKGKVFIVSGGAMGIGEAITRLIASEGGIPVIIGRSKEEGEKVVNDIRNTGGEAHSIHKELGTSESCREVIEETLAKFNCIDGIVNNAGGNDGVSLENGTPEAWFQSLQNNLHHYYFMSHFALPALKVSRGVILNISSKTALTGQGGTSAYAAAKGAQLAMTRDWAAELLKYSIRVNALIPSEVMTPMYQKWIDTFENPAEKIKSIEEKIPFENRMTTPEEIADTAVFLLSERASHITGQHIFVDGGYVHLDRSVSILNKK